MPRMQSRRQARIVAFTALGLVAALFSAVACSSNSTVTSAPAAPSTVNPISTTVASTPTIDSTVASTPTVDPLIACLATWPLRDRIALLVWPGAYSDQWADVEATVRDLHVGGVLLMKVADALAGDLATHLTELEQLSAHGLLVAVDEEGGDVQRLRVLDSFPSQEDMSLLTLDERTTILDRHAQVIASAGIDVVLGPIVDVRPLTGTDPLGDDRLFIGDPQQVAALGAEYVGAWQRAGMLPVLKHFPGHGGASADTHEQLATTASLDALRAYDLVPFQQLATSGAAVMVGHLNVPGLTDGQPASTNAAAVALLRELGYANALVLSDALGMDAIGIPVAEAAVMSVQAGIDVVIFTGIADAAPVIDALELAVTDGRLTAANIDDSALRVARLLEADGRMCS